MDADPRGEFLNRISSVGWGVRENVQLLTGAVVTTIREQVADGAFSHDEIPGVVAFHDAAEEFWRATMATNPPMEPVAMVTGLRDLLQQCAGQLAGFQVQVERALEQAKLLERLKSHREPEPPDAL
ncbi:MAG: hypothetical protein ACE5FJ_04505 [Gemmatimonadales bacterium]